MYLQFIHVVINVIAVFLLCVSTDWDSNKKLFVRFEYYYITILTILFKTEALYNSTDGKYINLYKVHDFVKKKKYDLRPSYV